jgi:hypothetical protein
LGVVTRAADLETCRSKKDLEVLSGLGEFEKMSDLLLKMD